MRNNLMGRRWEDAPEGTTHILYGIWRKVEEPEVKYWNGVEWKLHHNGIGADEFLARHNPEPRPVALPIVVINGVEVDWNKAPEGTTHALTNQSGVKYYGQWRKLENNMVYDFLDGAWKMRAYPDARMWLKVNAGSFVAHPNLVAVEPVKAEPVKALPKKQVGWWT